jgi:hypothetical protein
VAQVLVDRLPADPVIALSQKEVKTSSEFCQLEVCSNWIGGLAVAISSGSIIASHVNDGVFWIIAKYFNMSVKDTLKTWTVLETVLSAVMLMNFPP